ncbi:MAG TPA: PLD nuclease N-terminal domain-containing protein [Bacteroidales bacterium]|nr:PLD nuclease N-terminal domain-containing protein [Bacteroidales bacterium]
MSYDWKFYAAIMPVVLLNVILIIWCISDIAKRNKVKLFDKKIWILVIIFIQFIGPVTYLILGRGDDNDKVR